MTPAIRPYVRLAPIAALGLVSGCQCTPKQEADAPPPAKTAEQFSASIKRAEMPTPGNGAAPTGTALPPAELAAVPTSAAMMLGKVDGGCQFAQGGKVVFIAGAPASTDDKGKAVLVLDGRERVMPGADLGGMQVIESGPTVRDGEYSVEVLRKPGLPQVTGRIKRWGADLVITSGAGERRYPNGTWTCQS
ncbi:MAG: hypothetical protein IE933_02295 [Sphingomonadales bacterium]|nr:hypothetical protein [Sphingomonadales bacterium]MBD3772244.1 hypothetical protein [Paracoccaceae bacterium]